MKNRSRKHLAKAKDVLEEQQQQQEKLLYGIY